MMLGDDEFAVQVASLRNDAGVWQTTADTLGTAAAASNSLDLSGVDLSFAAVDEGLTTAYQELKGTITLLLHGGDFNITALTNTMTQVADAYESTDQTQRARFDGQWDPDAL